MGVGWFLPSLSKTHPPPDAWFSWVKDGEEGKTGSRKVLLGILHHPPWAPIRTLPLRLKTVSFLL